MWEERFENQNASIPNAATNTAAALKYKSILFQIH